MEQQPNDGKLIAQFILKSIKNSIIENVRASAKCSFVSFYLAMAGLDVVNMSWVESSYLGPESNPLASKCF